MAGISSHKTVNCLQSRDWKTYPQREDYLVCLRISVLKKIDGSVQQQFLIDHIRSHDTNAQL